MDCGKNRYFFLAPVWSLLTACIFALFVSSQVATASDRLYKLEAGTFPSTTEPEHVMLRMTYWNKSEVAVCFYQFDLNGFDPDGAYASIRDANDKPLRYIGPIYDVDKDYAPGFILLMPGQHATTIYDLTSTYGVRRQSDYSLTFRLSVTDCSVIIAGLKEIPGGPDIVGPVLNPEMTKDWAVHLEWLEYAYPLWTENGFIASLEDFRFRVD